MTHPFIRFFRCTLGLCLPCIVAATSAAAAQYFVSLEGNDSADGRSPATAFRTIQRGVDALNPGDTLTIAPGQYPESVSRQDLGSADVDTVIRAAIPGTVLLKGDVPLTGLQKVDGFRFVWQVPFEREPMAVIERDTLRLFDAVESLAELEFRPGAFHYDAERQILSLSTSDLQPPDQHHYSVAVINASGLYLYQPRRVIVDGIAATGFSNNTLLSWKESFGNHWGIFLRNASHCIVRNCTAFLNGGGIGVSSGETGGDNVIEGCTAYGNNSKFNVEGGNILCYQGNRDVIRNSVSYRSRAHGMRFYGRGGIGNVLFEDVLSWGNVSGDFWIKGISGNEPPGGGLARRAIALGRFHVRTFENSILGSDSSYNRDPNSSPESIRFLFEENLVQSDEFADPVNFDFRLQATSRFRNSAPDGSDRGPFPYANDVFFVSPDGDDSNPGTSAASPWRTLTYALRHTGKDDTLYISAGTYSEPVSLGRNAPHLRARGRDAVSLAGQVTIDGANGLSFERLIFTGDLTIRNSSNLSFDNCSFLTATPTAISSSSSLRLTHNIVSSPVGVRDSSGMFLSGNLYATPSLLTIDSTAAILYSDYNSYPAASDCWTINGSPYSIQQIQEQGFDLYSIIQAATLELSHTGVTPENTVPFLTVGPLGTSIGHYLPWQEENIRLVGPFVHSVTDTTLNLEWWTSAPARVELQWDTGDGWQSVQISQRNYFSYSLTELKPDSQVRWRLRLVEPYLHEPASEWSTVDSATWHEGSAVTEKLPHVPQIYYVAPDGDDSNDGLSRATAWRTVNHAADRVRPGDTVLLGEGHYRETTWLRATGDVDRPITFMAAPGEKVVFDGGQRQLFSAFVSFGKHWLNFDYLYGVGLGKIGGHDGAILPEQMGGMFVFSYSDEIEITRCWLDGRGSGYSVAFMNAFHSHDILVSNCILHGGFSGPNIIGSSDIEFRNCVFFRNLISMLTISNRPDQLVTVRDSIITDNLPVKFTVALLNTSRAEALRLDNNCFFARSPLEERAVLGVWSDVAYARALKTYEVDFEQEGLDLSVEINPRLRLAEAEELLGDTRSIGADPGFPGLADIPRTTDNGDPIYPLDRLGGRQLDFPDFFTTNPDLIDRGIGLDPSAFQSATVNP